MVIVDKIVRAIPDKFSLAEFWRAESKRRKNSKWNKTRLNIHYEPPT